MADANVALSSGATAMVINPANIGDGARGRWAAALMPGRAQMTFRRAGGGSEVDAEPSYPLIPFAAATARVSDRVTVGAALDAPFGNSLEWNDNDWRTSLGLDLAQRVELKVVRAGPAMAWQGDGGWSFGGRVFAQFVKAAEQSDFMDVHGDGVSGGYQLGVRWKGDRVIFGSAYTSRTDTEIDGEITSVHSVAAAGGVRAGSAKAAILLPDRWQNGVAFALRPNLWWEVDLDWFGWSYVDELTIYQSDGEIANKGKNARHNRNTLSVRTGIKWRYSDVWTWHAGVGYDPTPVPEQDVSPVTSMLRKTRVAFGAEKTLSNDMKLGFAYQFIRGHARTVNETDQDSLGGTDTNLYEGTYESASHAIGVTVAGQF